MLRLLRNTRSLVLAAAAVTLAACADDPMAPGPDLAFSGGKLPSAAKVKLLKRTPPLKTVETKSLTITATKGGTITLPTAGLTVTVPVGAIRTGSLTITVRAHAGKSVAYDFQPHGVVFAKPLTLTQDLGKTSWKQLGNVTLYGGYYPGEVDDANSLATITESFPIRITTDGKKVNRASFDIWHFSGYIVSTGRADGEPDASLGM
ncbi:MAG: hypothetical protein RLZ32_2602 [Gemmatimonadota bacterium]